MYKNLSRLRGINTRKTIIISIIIVIAIFTLTGCVPGDGANNANNKAGFFMGVWHGWIAPFSLIYSLFKENITIYEVNNVGWLYDFGYYIAIISGFGGFALSRRKKTYNSSN